MDFTTLLPNAVDVVTSAILLVAVVVATIYVGVKAIYAVQRQVVLDAKGDLEDDIGTFFELQKKYAEARTIATLEERALAQATKPQ